MIPLPPSRPRAVTLDGSSRPRLTAQDACITPAPPQRLLIVALDALRDVVLASALTPLLRARYPAAEITLWCNVKSAGVGALVPGVDRVEAADPCWHGPEERRVGSVSAFVGSVSRLRRHKFDVALLTAAQARTSAAVALTGATTRIGAALPHGARWLTTPLAALDTAKPALTEMARLLEPLGIQIPRALHYSLRPEPLTHRVERLRPLLGPRPVALYPFAAEAAHTVPLKHWIRVAVELSRRGFDPIWIGSTRQLRDVHRAVGSSAWAYVDRIGDESLADSAAAISLSRLFVGHDSGMLHLAAALGVAVAGVFTPGDGGHAYPQGTGESRLLLRRTPDGVTCDQILDLVNDLPVRPALQLVR